MRARGMKRKEFFLEKMLKRIKKSGQDKDLPQSVELIKNLLASLKQESQEVTDDTIQAR